MNVIINGVLFQGEWSEGSFKFVTDMTLAQIEAAFTPGENVNIIVSEGEQEIARYYNKGLESIKVEGVDPRTVTVVFSITQISGNAETEIRGELEDSDGAIVELAEIVAGLSEIDAEGIAAELQSHQETINTWFSNASDIQQFIADLRKEGGILDMFDARITALEHEVGIASIAMNAEEEEQNNG